MLKDDLKHEELQINWPTWRDILVAVLDVHKPKGRDWTEREKYLTLMTHGGQHVRVVATFTTEVEGEVRTGNPEQDPQFSNLILRCNAAFKACDPTTEITILRALQQKKDESIREFLDKARKQISLCGYATAQERDRELVMLLKTNTVDATEISKHATGQGLQQLEALAINLEGIRQRLAREAGAKKEKAAKLEESVYAVMDKMQAYQRISEPSGSERKPLFSNQTSQPSYSTNQQQNKSGKGDCNGCGRRGGHDPGYRCIATNLKCHNCGRSGHFSKMCRAASRGGPSGAGASGDRGRPRGRVNQVGFRDRIKRQNNEVNRVDDGWSS